MSKDCTCQACGEEYSWDWCRPHVCTPERLAEKTKDLQEQIDELQGRLEVLEGILNP